MANPFGPLRDALQQLDHDLRKKGTCRKCGKPTSGFIPVGMTREQAGICDCEERAEREKRNVAARARRQVYADLGLKRVRGNRGGLLRAALAREKERAMKNHEQYQEALSRAASGITMSNYPAIFAGFAQMGIPESEIKPRENIFTYNAWKALGRHVKKGQHGIRVLTFIDISKEDKETGGKKSYSRPWHTTGFHISQTEPDKRNGQPATAPQVMPETAELNEESAAAPQGFKIEDPMSGQTIGSF